MPKTLIQWHYPVDFTVFFRTTFLRKLLKTTRKTKEKKREMPAISSIQEYPSQHLLIQSERWTHQNNVWNLF